MINRDGEWHETTGGRYRILAQQECSEGLDDLRQIETSAFTGYIVASERRDPTLPNTRNDTLRRYRSLPDAIVYCAELMGVTAPEVRRAVDLTRVTCSRWKLADCVRTDA